MVEPRKLPVTEWKNQQSVCTPYMGTVEAIEMDPEEDHEDDQSTGAPLL